MSLSYRAHLCNICTFFALLLASSLRCSGILLCFSAYVYEMHMAQMGQEYKTDAVLYILQEALHKISKEILHTG